MHHTSALILSQLEPAGLDRTALPFIWFHAFRPPLNLEEELADGRSVASAPKYVVAHTEPCTPIVIGLARTLDKARAKAGDEGTDLAGPCS